jgi:hypothetical protein
MEELARGQLASPKGATAAAWRAARQCGGTSAGRHANSSAGQHAWRRRRKQRLGELGHENGEFGRGTGGGWKRIDRKRRVIRGLRSARCALTGRGGRLTGRGGAASGHSPVSSWSDRTCPVRADRTQTESGRRSSGKLIAHDRTRWWIPGPDAVVNNDASGRASGHRSKRKSSGRPDALVVAGTGRGGEASLRPVQRPVQRLVTDFCLSSL